MRNEEKTALYGRITGLTLKHHPTENTKRNEENFSLLSWTAEKNRFMTNKSKQNVLTENTYFLQRIFIDPVDNVMNKIVS